MTFLCKMKPVVFSIFLEVAVAILQMSDGYQNYALLKGTEQVWCVSTLFFLSHHNGSKLEDFGKCLPINTGQNSRAQCKMKPKVIIT